MYFIFMYYAVEYLFNNPDVYWLFSCIEIFVELLLQTQSAQGLATTYPFEH